MVEPAYLYSSVTVAVRFDYTAQLDSVAYSSAYRFKIRANTVHIYLRPQSAGENKVFLQIDHLIFTYIKLLYYNKAPFTILQGNFENIILTAYVPKYRMKYRI